MSAVQYPMCVMAENAPILLEAMFANVLEGLPQALMDLAALVGFIGKTHFSFIYMFCLH